MDDKTQDFILEVISAGGGRVLIDWKQVIRDGRGYIQQEGTEMFRSRMVGMGMTAGTKDSPDAIFRFTYMTSKLVNLRMSYYDVANEGISHARALYSIEFQYADGGSLTFGDPHPRTKGTNIPIDASGGEIIIGFKVRASKWVDAVKVVTNRKESSWLGSVGSGRVYNLVPPHGYDIIGIYGKHGRCCDGFGVLYTSNS
jgi:hypothetical protein